MFELNSDVKFPLLRILLFVSDLKSTILSQDLLDSIVVKISNCHVEAGFDSRLGRISLLSKFSLGVAHTELDGEVWGNTNDFKKDTYCSSASELEKGECHGYKKT